MGSWNPAEAWKHALDILIAGDFERLPVTIDCEITEPGIGSHIGWDEEHQKRLRDYVAAFSDYKITFTNTVSQGKKCAVEVQYEMTHTGPLEGPDRMIPATGKRLKVMGAYFVTFTKEGEGALISNIHQFFDLMEPFQQIEAA